MKLTPRTIDFFYLADKILASNLVGNNLDDAPCRTLENGVVPRDPTRISLRAQNAYVILGRNVLAYLDMSPVVGPQVVIQQKLRGDWFTICASRPHPTRALIFGPGYEHDFSLPDAVNDRVEGIAWYWRSSGWPSLRRLPDYMLNMLPAVAAHDGPPAFNKALYLSALPKDDEVFSIATWQPPQKGATEAFQQGLLQPACNWFAPARIARAQAQIMRKNLPERMFFIYTSPYFNHNARGDGKWGARIHVMALSGESATVDVMPKTTMRDLAAERRRIYSWAMNNLPIPGPMI